QSGEKASGEELIRAPDGREMHCWSTKIPLFRNGEIDGLIGFSTDISELVKLKNRFYELARIDTLTGVLTRRFLLDHAETILKRTQRRSGRMALLMIDLDRFKEINDTYGHAFGDAYLVAVVEACRRTLRDGDLMGRLGGDEFVIVLDDIDDTGLRAVAARFRNAVRASAISAPDGMTLHPSISIGTAISDPASTVDSLLVAADAALYREKGDGKDAPRHGEC
ncbi:MAG: GGDEF domain-containing protein, partial [Betaproteobacteria bacterium]|nr:GGDEF domain-containing protein [Betaproteobacteria bacterium]